jgi:hypothetical protein
VRAAAAAPARQSWQEAGRGPRTAAGFLHGATRRRAAPPAHRCPARRQIEYYFSDSNFRRDKFLRAKANEDADGYVALTVLLTFNRVKALTMGAWRRRLRRSCAPCERPNGGGGASPR